MLTTLITLVALAAAVAPADQELDNRLIATLDAAYDAGRGGLVAKDGTPMESAVELAFLLGRERQDSTWTLRALRTIEFTLTLQDTLGGGFVTRPANNDRDRLGLEKNTIPNARRLDNLMDAMAANDDPRWRQAAVNNIEFFDRVLIDGRGGFVVGQHGDRPLVGEANGWAIRAWMRWASLDGDPRGREFAWRSLDRVWSECWLGPAGFVRKGDFGEITVAPRLVDQVEMGRAFLQAAHLAGRAVDLERAREIADTLLRVYPDPKGGFHSEVTPMKGGAAFKGSGADLEENARAARFLAELAAVTGESRYRDAARAVAPTFEKQFRKPDLFESTEWALALRAMVSPNLPERTRWKVPASAKPRPRAKRF